MRMWWWFNLLIRVHKSKIEQQNQSNHTRFHIRVGLPFPSSYVLTQEPRPVSMVLDLQGPLVTPDVQFWACCVEISTKKSLPTYLRTYTEVLTTYQVKVYILVAFFIYLWARPLRNLNQLNLTAVTKSLTLAMLATVVESSNWEKIVHYDIAGHQDVMFQNWSKLSSSSSAVGQYVSQAQITSFFNDAPPPNPYPPYWEKIVHYDIAGHQDVMFQNWSKLSSSSSAVVSTCHRHKSHHFSMMHLVSHNSLIIVRHEQLCYHFFLSEKNMITRTFICTLL